MTSFLGKWASEYSYLQGPEDQPVTNHHGFRFEPTGEGRWQATNHESSDGSQVTLELAAVCKGQRIIGFWTVATAANGYYGGHEFEGMVVFTLAGPGQYKGEWAGRSRSGNIKGGPWTLTLLPE